MEALGFAAGPPVVAGVLQDIMVYGFRVLFFLSAVLLMLIVLLQEGKGGGLASALGGQGAETFGVSSGGVNKVTLTLAAIFLVSALGHALAYDRTVTGALLKEGRSKGAGSPVNPRDDLLRQLKEQGIDVDGLEDGKPGPGGDGGKTGGTEGSKEPPKDAPKEEPAKAPAETPKEQPKEQPKETPPAPPKDGE
jgi:protein translocase SecG subunit